MRSSELYKHAIERLCDVTSDLHNLFVIFTFVLMKEEKGSRKSFLRRLSENPANVITQSYPWQRLAGRMFVSGAEKNKGS